MLQSRETLLQKKREYAKKWRAQNPEAARSKAIRYRENLIKKHGLRAVLDVELARKKLSSDRVKARDPIAFKRSQFEKQLKVKYRLSIHEYAQLHQVQNYSCASCGEPFTPERGNDIAVDHDHETGKVRGMLHGKCNTALGLLGEDPKKIRALADYIEACNG